MACMFTLTTCACVVNGSPDPRAFDMVAVEVGSPGLDQKKAADPVLAFAQIGSML